jgi:hypothetical protein
MSSSAAAAATSVAICWFDFVPPDLFKWIVQTYLSDVPLLFLVVSLLVSKRFKAAVEWTNSKTALRLRSHRNKAPAVRFTCQRLAYTIHAWSHASLSLGVWIYTQLGVPISKNCYTGAATSGRVDVLDWLMSTDPHARRGHFSNNDDIYQSIQQSASTHGHQSVFDWCRKQLRRKFTLDYKALECIIKRGHVDLLRYLFDVLKCFDTRMISADIFLWAAASGSIPMLRYVCEKVRPGDSEWQFLAMGAAQSGNIEMLEYVRSSCANKDKNYDNLMYYHAVFEGHTNIVRFIRDHAYVQLSAEDIQESIYHALVHGHVDLAKMFWAKPADGRCDVSLVPLSFDILFGSSDHANTNVLEFLRAQDPEMFCAHIIANTTRFSVLLLDAAIMCDVKLLKLLKAPNTFIGDVFHIIYPLSRAINNTSDSALEFVQLMCEMIESAITDEDVLRWLKHTMKVHCEKHNVALIANLDVVEYLKSKQLM